MKYSVLITCGLLGLVVFSVPIDASANPEALHILQTERAAAVVRLEKSADDAAKNRNKADIEALDREIARWQKGSGFAGGNTNTARTSTTPESAAANSQGNVAAAPRSQEAYTPAPAPRGQQRQDYRIGVWEDKP
jgi:hypothetical protein